ncbi:putative ribonuclease H-like domain-containing protein [Tanacetum coccineum]|uniref:Ribonuclease H-like domain-containing protein n=1 Tax=Tanacetum coccineum TaxID=301880 RepID=A0ABQ5DWX0_9ASTR
MVLTTKQKKVVSGNNYNRVDNYYYAKTSHHRTHKNVTPRAVLLRTGLKPLSTAKSVYTAHPKPTVHCARPKTHFFKSAQSTVQRPFYKKPALTNRHFNHKVNTVRPRIVNTARSYKTPVNIVRPRVINTARQNRTSVNAARVNGFNDVKPSACWVWRPIKPNSKPQHDDKGFVDSGCSRHMTGSIAYLSDFKQFDGGYVAFGGGAYGGKILGKGTLKTTNLDFEDVYFLNELKFNLFSVSQMCDKKNYVLFTDTKCLVLSPNFKLHDENQILLKVSRKDNMYSFDMKNIVPKESLTCLVAKATLDESMLWHRRLGHINFKNINKLVKDNLVRGLPTKHFENDQTCVACLKGKQHRASCKSKVLNPITKPLFMLHMDLFGPTFVSSLMHKKYCLVVTDDYSRFTWVFFLTTKDETSEILKRFIKEIENLVDKKVKIIRSDNGTEFKNKVMDDFCREKGIKREYSVARTPQQNGVAERRNRTLIEAARTMLADSKLPTTFWAEAVSTACYVQNRVLVVKPHNKTPYELFRGFKPALSFMRPFGCHVTILNTLDSLGKFDGKSDEGFFVGYSLSSKAFRVYNTRTKRVEENLHIGFLENKPMIEGTGPKWLFDIDSLTQSMNYVPVSAGTVSNVSAGTSEENSQDCIVMPIWKDTSYFDSPTKNVDNGEPKTADDAQKQVEDGLNNENAEQERFADDSSSKDVNAVGQQVNTASLDVNTVLKSTAWNEFSSSMASFDHIAWKTNQKFNFSKYILDAIGEYTWMEESNSCCIHVLDLQKAKDAQAKEIDALKKRIQRLERRKISRPTGLKRLKKVGMSRRVESSADQESLGVPEDASKQGRSIEDIDADIDVSLVDETQERQDDDLIFDTGILDDVEMPVEAKVDGKDEQSTKKLDDSTAGEAVTTADDDSVVPTTNEEITLAQTLIQIKAAKPKVVTTADTTTTTTRPKDKGVVVQEPSEFRVPQEIKPSSSKDKGKGIMIEPEVPLKRKDQIALDEQIARDIQAKLDAELLEEQKLARKQMEEANIALIKVLEN